MSDLAHAIRAGTGHPAGEDVRMGSTRKQVTSWISVSIALSGAIFLEFTGELVFLPEMPATRSTSLDGQVDEWERPAAATPSKDLLQELLARPLFSASRRPGADLSGATAIEMVGTMLVDGAMTVVLNHPEEGSGFLSQGDVFGDWTIGRIEVLQVDLEKEANVERLELRKHRPQPATPVESQQNSEEPKRGGMAKVMAKIEEKNATSREKKDVAELEEFAKESERRR